MEQPLYIPITWLQIASKVLFAAQLDPASILRPSEPANGVQASLQNAFSVARSRSYNVPIRGHQEGDVTGNFRYIRVY